MSRIRLVLVGVVLLLAGCGERALPDLAPSPSVTPTVTVTPAQPEAAPATPVAAEKPASTATVSAEPTATMVARQTPETDPEPGPYRGPFPAGEEARCGVLLPVLPASSTSKTQSLDETQSLEAIPEAARPALARILEVPESVGLAAYEVGQEEAGLFLNAQTPMPLASVVKIVHLIAYAEAIQAGELDPQMPVPLAEMEQYYLRNSDLNAHPEAVEALRAEGLVSGDPPSVPLETVPRMMIEFSSNAATDYLHQLLGQQRLEETILDLGLSSHTAPCPFLGQFLLMGTGDAIGEVEGYLEDPASYSRDVWAVTEAYVAGESVTSGWRGRDRRPSLETQAYFSEELNAQASAGDYAALMAQIAENELGPWEQSVRIRRYLEWPTFFDVNQRTLAWLGYKGGSLPGIMTVAYYAQPWDAARPVVVVLFFRDLPLSTFRQWRRNLPHDELARWLLYEREAIPLVREMMATGD